MHMLVYVFSIIAKTTMTINGEEKETETAPF